MIPEIKNKLSQAHSFIDEAFEVKNTSAYQLVIQIGLDAILLVVNEKAKNKYIAFEKYTLQNTYNFDVLSELLDEVLNKSSLIKHKYKSVACIIVNNLSTLVPSPFYDSADKATYLKFIVSLQGDELILVDEIKNIDAKNIFALSIKIKAKLDYLYSNISYHHYSSCLINGLLIQAKNQTAKKIYVHVGASHVEFVFIEGKNLLFYNTFNYHTAEDFIYYLLFVFEQLQLNPEKTEVNLVGEIEKSSAIYALIQKYIRNIKFAERIDTADYSYQLQTLPKHYYFTLFNDFFI